MRVLRILSSVILCTALLWGLVAYGATQRHSLYQLLVVLGAATVIALWAYPVERLMLARFLPVLAVGVLLLVQILRLPPLRQEGYVLLAVGWAGLLLALLVGQEDRGRRRLLLFLVAIGLLEAFTGLVQALTEGRLATGTYINRNHFAGLLNMTIPLAIGALYATYPRRGSRLRSEGYAWAWIVILVGAFMGVAILLSLSRGGTLSLVAAIIFIAVLLAGNRTRNSRTLSSWAGWILLFTVVGLGLWIGIDALLLRFAEENPGTDRIAVYRSSLKLIADYPLGVGPSMYQWYFRPYQPAGPMCWFSDAHNDYLQTFAEWGIGLAVLFWGFVLWRLISAVRTFLGGDDLWRQGTALGCAAAILSILLHSFVDFNLQIPVNAVIFCIILGLTWTTEPPRPRKGTEENGKTGESGVAGSPDKTPDSLCRRTPKGLAIALRLGLTVLVGTVCWTAGKQVVALNVARTPEVPEVEKYQEALRWSPDEPTFHAELGRIYRDDPEHLDVQEARKHLERAVELNPHNGEYWRELSRCYEMAGDFEEAEKTIRKALSLTPHQAADHWRLGNFYLRQDRTAEAVENIRQTIALDSRYHAPAALLLWKAGFLEQNIEKVWAAEHQTILPLMWFLIAREAPAATVLRQWDRMIAAGQAPTPNGGAFFLEFLLKQGLTDEAREQWVLLNEKAGITDDTFRTRKNFVWNSGFELPTQGGVFGWSIPVRGPYRAEVVEGEGVAGSKGLRADFDGTQNLAVGIRQVVIVEAGRDYRFSCQIKAQDVSTDQGLFFRLLDSTSGKVLVETNPVLGSRPWEHLGGDFTVAEGTRRIHIVLTRNPSRKLDNKLAGTVWVDDVRVCLATE